MPPTAVLFPAHPPDCERGEKHKLHCGVAMTDMAVVVPFSPPDFGVLVNSLHLWSHRDYFPCDPSGKKAYRKHIDLIFQFTVRPPWIPCLMAAAALCCCVVSPCCCWSSVLWSACLVL